MGYETEERRISIDELKQSFLDHSLTEAFGAGTAAVVAPIKTINIEGEEYHLPAYTDNTIHVNIKNKLNAIRNGSEEDTDNWNYVV
jgi:branched-chain amino acid aminotransferase